MLLLKRYAENWAKTVILESQAEMNLTAAEKDLTQELEAYRSALLTFRYKEKLVYAKMDTVVTEQESRSYYDQHAQDFVLDRDIVQCVFVHLPITAPSLDEVKQWIKSDTEEDMMSLAQYCLTNAVRYQDFEDQWISVRRLESILPFQLEDMHADLYSKPLIAQEDSTSCYLLGIRNYRAADQVAPYEYAIPNVRNVILNQRKLRFISSVENELYEDALSKDRVEIKIR